MNRLAHKTLRQTMRQKRTRASITTSADRPRLSITITSKHVTAQVIDDTKHTTIAYASTVGSKDAQGTLSEKAAWVGTEIAKKAKKAKVKKVALDRGGRLYHGRVKAFAEAAREGGLEF